MKNIKFLLLFVLLAGLFAIPAWWYIAADREENDPDFPAGVNVDKGEYLAARDEQFALLRGLDTAEQGSRSRAIREMEASEQQLAARPGSIRTRPWKPLGPAPIPNGQTQGRSDPVSGRTVAIAVDPTDANIVYVGTAQGGLYRSLDGGEVWRPLLDGALSLAIGSVTIAPSDPSIVYVGTGESGLSLDSFFGVGVYRIDGANTAAPIVSGPYNRDGGNRDIFTGRSAADIIVHPTDPNIIYVCSVSGQAGLGSTTGATLPPRGLYRSVNAAGSAPVFEPLIVSPSTEDRPIIDGVMEPGNPDRIFVTLVDSTGHGDGGVYFTSNASAAAPVFTRLFATATGAELGRAELAIQKTENMVTVYCAHGTGGGRLSKTTYDATAPGLPAFTTLKGGTNFCSPQCFYDIAVAVDPGDADAVYLAGSPAMPFGYSTSGGESFTSSTSGLHVDTHALAVAPSDSNVIYYGSDGGIWRSNNRGLIWASKNNETFSATQFESVAVHPNDRHYTLGGTQDNGTEYLFPDGRTWIRAVGGDGGYVVIDSNSPSNADLTSYHTFFNRTNTQIGFARSTTTQPTTGAPIYGGLLGCGGTPNGISCADATLFYAPLVLGPDTDGSDGNTVYFGSNRLYRSIDQGTTMSVVSQTLPDTAGNERVSAIAISPQNDNVRLIGSTTGKLYYSNTAAATTMTNVTGTVPARFIGRIAISPTDENTAYVAVGGFGIPNRHVMKTTNLNAPSPTWVNAGIGIPDVPTNGLVIDPSNPDNLYAATDVGVFQSTDAAASWVPMSNGLPRVAAFQIVMQPTERILKIATHGRGVWEFDLNASGSVQSDFDGDGRSDLAVFRGSDGNWYRRYSSTDLDDASGWGVATDRIAPGDHDGDAKTDLVVYRPSTGTWFLYQSRAGFSQVNFGIAEDLPVQGDYDGDGKTDIAVYRPSTGVWHLNQSMAGPAAIAFGTDGDKPVPGDYDGDGRTDVAVFRPSEGIWYLNSSTAGFSAIPFGSAGDLVTPADYDGDGKTDIGVFRPSDGMWYLLRSKIGFLAQPWGQSGDIPVPGDLDGDGQADIAVFRPSDGTWYRLNSSDGGFFAAAYGLNGDKPILSAYVPEQ